MKTKVFGVIHWIIVGLNIIDAFWVIVILFSGQLLEMNGGELVFSLMMMISMMIILPIGLLLYSLLVYNSIIKVDQSGVYKIKFKKVSKFFDWNEIKTIGFTSEDIFTGWAYISNVANVKFTHYQVDKMLNSNIICFHLTKKNKSQFEQMIRKYYKK